MALNTSNKEIIAYRRQRVAEMRLLRIPQRQIVKALADEGLVNPLTGKPFSLGTVNTDIEALQARWQREYLADTDRLASSWRSCWRPGASPGSKTTSRASFSASSRRRTCSARAPQMQMTSNSVSAPSTALMFTARSDRP